MDDHERDAGDPSGTPTGQPSPGTLDGVELHLAVVDVGSGLTVRLEGRGARAQEDLRAHREERARWEASVAAAREVTTPPPWPAERLAGAHLGVGDAAGTAYRFVSGVAGGAGREWRYDAVFRPAPPRDVRAVTLALVLDDGPTSVDVPLPPGR
ncbi:hypothetical protein [Cellulomonas telluris]|uniref:hypothetical protein n=1 Tax=Cellulomonas telluris TaxID=2306636 RepID=UPI0010A7ADB5|nr:hypothetical protein [Cellulomonas telluris]